MAQQKTTFALYFGNRGSFPASLIAGARQQMQSRLAELGHNTLIMDAELTAHGAIETPREGEIYANWLRKHQGEFGGVILSLPNFGDENGAIAALKDCGVPILIQAYPDEFDKMAPELRRDAFCGKFSIMDVFRQNALKFTALKPHTQDPASAGFAANVDYFDRMCRVVGGMKDIVVGAIGARTTAFKTVRIDEVALQRQGITMETLDLSVIFARVAALEDRDEKVQAKAERLRGYTNWDAVPDEAFDKLVKLGVAIDQVVEEYRMDALAIRCWIEMQQQLGISPCVLLSEMNDRGVITACEVDIGNAVAMRALALASGDVVTCLDWNNNYGDDEDKCILFHCGPVPQTMMTDRGCVADHAILANAVGKGNAYGPCEGRIKPMPFTFGSMLTEDGQMKFYLGEARFTDDPIADDFFGCAGVMQMRGLQDALQTIGYLGHRHHVSVTPQYVAGPIYEALTKYIGCEVTCV